MNTFEIHECPNPSGPLGLDLGEGLGPFAELHEPASEFEDGTWHKPLPQGWSGGRLVYTAEQVAAAVAAERERWAQHLEAIAARRDADDPHARSLRWVAAEMRAYRLG